MVGLGEFFGDKTTLLGIAGTENYGTQTHVAKMVSMSRSLKGG